MKKLALSTLFVLALSLSFTSCRDTKKDSVDDAVEATEGAMEETGKAVDEAVEDTKGAMEETGQAVDEAVEKADEAIKKTGEAVK